MRSFLKVAVPVVLIAGVVSVIAYMTQNTARNPAGIRILNTPPTPTVGDLITFDQDQRNLEDMRPEDNRPMEVEFQSHQHKDFWFHTNQEKDVLLGLWSKSCGCADVELGSFDLTDQEWESLAASPTPAALCQLLKAAKFEKLGETKHNQYSRLQGTPPGRLPKPFVLRVNWKVKEPSNKGGDETLRIQVNGILEGGQPQEFTREVKFKVVPGTGFWPGGLDLGDVTPGSIATKECFVWTQTRDRLDFAVRVTAAGDSKQSEPCAEISPPEKLNEREMAELTKQLDPEKKLKIQLRCAYRFRVTLSERRGEDQLEMGPFIRRLVINYQRTSPEEEALVDLRPSISAYVRGEVSVLNGDEVGRVTLGTFRFDRPQKLDVRLGSIDPKLELEFDSCTHEKMHVKLSEPMDVEGRREWLMHVDLEANALIGDFTHQILLRVKGKSGRRLRIPINGSAERER